MARPEKSKKIQEEAGISSQAIEQTATESSQEMESSPSEEQIRLRAYELYIERGGGDGNDSDDWLQAERELRGTAEAQDIAE